MHWLDVPWASRDNLDALPSFKAACGLADYGYATTFLRERDTGRPTATCPECRALQEARFVTKETP